MPADVLRPGFALLVDVPGSRDESDFVAGRDKRLKALSARHVEQGWVRSPYTVTAWDEFQTFLWDGRAVPRVILELRQRFVPWELRIGVGQGGIRGWRTRRPINEAVGGPPSSGLGKRWKRSRKQGRSTAG